MINKLQIVVSILLVWIVLGCKKEFLEPKPLSFYSPQNTFDNPEALQSILYTCESTLREQYLMHLGPFLTELIFSEVAVFGKTDAASPAQNLNLSITPDAELNNPQFNRIGWWWDESYRTIKNSNVVISRIDLPEYTSEQQRNSILSAAYFHRAYRYYGLVHQFGDVPFILNEIQEPRINFYSTKREVILLKLKEDLEYAVQWLSDDVSKGQVTKGAAGHLLTKINLSLGLFDDAIKSSTDIIDGGIYKLMTERFGIDADNPNKNVNWDLHRPQNKSLQENTEALMLVIDRFNEIGNYRPASNLMRRTSPNWHSNINTPNGNKGTLDQAGIEIDQSSVYGRGVGHARSTWYNSHTIWINADNDYRYSSGNWMRMENLVYNNINIKNTDPYYGKPLQLYGKNNELLCSDTIRCWFDWPHYKVFVEDNIYVPARGGHTDYYVSRLAETYLLRAEAYFWQGNTLNASRDINVVRDRANALPISPENINIGTILDERARELYYEELRNIELTRIAYIFANTRKVAYNGQSYDIENFSEHNFWFDRIMEKTDFYNQGVKTNYGNEFTMSPFHVLWPIPIEVINSNSAGVINQNKGYSGFENNVPPLSEIIK